MDFLSLDFFNIIFIFLLTMAQKNLILYGKNLVQAYQSRSGNLYLK